MENSDIIKRDVIFKKHSKKFVKETLKLEDNNIIDWYYLDSPKSVIVVPITRNEELVLVRQYRYNLRKHTYEFPAGFTKNPKETTFLQAAKVELLEETGYESKKYVDLGTYYNLPSETNRWTKIFLALDTKKVTTPKLDNIIEKYFDISVELKGFKKTCQRINTKHSLVKSLEHILALKLAKEYLESNPK